MNYITLMNSMDILHDAIGQLQDHARAERDMLHSSHYMDYWKEALAVLQKAYDVKRNAVTSLSSPRE